MSVFISPRLYFPNIILCLVSHRASNNFTTSYFIGQEKNIVHTVWKRGTPDYLFKCRRAWGFLRVDGVVCDEISFGETDCCCASRFSNRLDLSCITDEVIIVKSFVWNTENLFTNGRTLLLWAVTYSLVKEVR